MRSTVASTTIDLDDDAVDLAAAKTANGSIPVSQREGVTVATVQLPVYVDVDGERTEIGTIRTDISLGVAEQWYSSPEAAARRVGLTEADPTTIPKGPARAPDPEAVDELDAERAARAQARAAGDTAAAPVVESTLRDITPYECAQEAAATLRAQFLPESGPAAAAVANSWLSLGLAMATHGPLNKPGVEGDR